jgi:hypothetical protein
MKIKLVISILALLFVTGCANTSQENYYRAIGEAAEANARQQEARYLALSGMAASQDPTTSAVATMAIAMTQDRIVAPQYVESESLTWGRILAAPVAAVAGIALQADVAKNASDNAARVQMANFQSQENIQLGNQSMVLGLGQQYAESTAATAVSVGAIADLGQAGFDALAVSNQAGLDATTGIASQGLDAVSDVSRDGFVLAEDLYATGLGAVVETATQGYEYGQANFSEISNDYQQIIDSLISRGVIISP